MPKSVKKTANNGQFKAGAQPGPGRPKGVPNKATALVKDAILQAAQEAGGGGKDGIAKYLQKQADDNPGPFMALLGKILPTQIDADVDLIDKRERKWLVEVAHVDKAPAITDNNPDTAET